MNQITPQPQPQQQADIMSVSSLLRGRRAALGLRQRDVAERAGITVELYKQYEQGRALPVLPKAMAVARALEFDPAEFFSELDDDMSPAASKARVRGILPQVNEAVDDDVAENSDVTEPPSPALSILYEIADLRRAEGINSKIMPRLLSKAERLLSGIPLDDLYGLAEEVEVDGIPADAEEGDQARNLTAQVLVAALYGGQLAGLSYDQVNDLCGIVAKAQGTSALGVVWNVPGQPHFETNEDFEVRAKMELAPKLLELAKSRKAPESLLRSEDHGEEQED